MRYLFQIQFKNDPTGSWSIEQPFKTLREAYSCKDILDDTVYKAQIVDNVTTARMYIWYREDKNLIEYPRKLILGRSMCKARLDAEFNINKLPNRFKR